MWAELPLKYVLSEKCIVNIPAGLSLRSPMFKQLTLFLFTCTTLLSAYAQQVEIVVQQGHNESILDAAISEGGAYMATASADQTVKLWDIRTGKLLRTLIGHTAQVWSLAFIPEKNALVSCGDDGKVKIWDINTGKSLKTYEDTSQVLRVMTTSRNGSWIAAGGEGNMVKLWSWNSNTPVYQYKDSENAITALAISPEDSLMAIMAFRKIKVVHIPDGKVLFTFETDPSPFKLLQLITGELYFQPDNKQLVSQSGGIVTQWDLEKGEKIWQSDTDYYYRKIVPTASPGIWLVSRTGYEEFGTKKKIGRLTDPHQALVAFPETSPLSIFQKNMREVGRGHELGVIYDKDSAFVCHLKNRDIVRGFPLNRSGVKINDGAWLPDGKRIVLAIEKKPFIPIFDLGRLENYRSLQPDPEVLHNLTAEPGSWKNLKKLPEIHYGLDFMGDYFMVNTERGTFTWKLSRKQPFAFEGKTPTLLKQPFVFRSDSSTVMVTEDKSFNTPSQINVLDRPGGKTIKSFKGPVAFDIERIKLSEHENYLATSGMNQFSVWQISNGKKIIANESKEVHYLDVSFNHDQSKVITSALDLRDRSWLEVYDITSGKREKKIPLEGAVTGSDLHPQAPMIATCGINQPVVIWDLNDYSVHAILSDAIFWYQFVRFSPDGKKLMGGGFNGALDIWELEHYQKLASIIPVGQNDFLIYTPDGYYATTKEGINSIAFRLNNRVYPPSQFDLRFNRPDIILRRLGYADAKSLNQYEKAFHKRLRKLEITERQLTGDINLPTLKISNIEQIALTTKQPELSLQLVAKGSISTLDQINVWVNGVPVFGRQGFRGFEESTHIEKTISFPLNSGLNKVEVNVINRQGIASLSQVFNITRSSPERKPDLYYIGVGISDYLNNDLNLNYAVKDARDLGLTLGTLNSRFRKVHLDTIFNQDAVPENIMELRDKLMETSVDDQVIMFLAGHGMLDQGFNFNFATYDVDIQAEQINGLTFEHIEGLLDSIPARRKLLLIDACHSGEVDVDAIDNAALEYLSHQAKNQGTIRRKSFSKIRQNIFKYTKLDYSSFNLMNELFVNLGRGSGASIISAAAGDSYAFEAPRWNNGVFTYVLLHGLESGKADEDENGTITVSELYHFVIPTVERLTNGEQTPTSRRINRELDFRVW